MAPHRTVRTVLAVLAGDATELVEPGPQERGQLVHRLRVHLRGHHGLEAEEPTSDERRHLVGGEQRQRFHPHRLSHRRRRRAIRRWCWDRTRLAGRLVRVHLCPNPTSFGRQAELHARTTRASGPRRAVAASRRGAGGDRGRSMQPARVGPTAGRGQETTEDGACCPRLGGRADRFRTKVNAKHTWWARARAGCEP